MKRYSVAMAVASVVVAAQSASPARAATQLWVCPQVDEAALVTYHGVTATSNAADYMSVVYEANNELFRAMEGIVDSGMESAISAIFSSSQMSNIHGTVNYYSSTVSDRLRMAAKAKKGLPTVTLDDFKINADVNFNGEKWISGIDVHFTCNVPIAVSPVITASYNPATGYLSGVVSLTSLSASFDCDFDLYGIDVDSIPGLSTAIDYAEQEVNSKINESLQNNIATIPFNVPIGVDGSYSGISQAMLSDPAFSSLNYGRDFNRGELVKAMMKGGFNAYFGKRPSYGTDLSPYAATEALETECPAWDPASSDFDACVGNVIFEVQFPSTGTNMIYADYTWCYQEEQSPEGDTGCTNPQMCQKLPD